MEKMTKHSVADEKYSIASMMRVSSRFTLLDIAEKLGLEQVPQAMYTVLGEMLEKELIESFQQSRITFKAATNTFDNTVVKVYQIIAQKQEELKQYIEELGRQRLQPDIQGKPRGLNYRVAEQLIEKVSKDHNKLKKEEAAIELYLTLAQEDEMSQSQNDPCQRVVSEAYLRMLYGEYLVIKQQRMDGIVQFLKACHLFCKSELSDRQRIAEARACETLIQEYDQRVNQEIPFQQEYYYRAKESLSFQIKSNMLDFAQIIEGTIGSIESKLPPTFLAIVHYVNKAIKEKTELVPPKRERYLSPSSLNVASIEGELVDQPPMTLFGLEQAPQSMPYGWLRTTPLPVNSLLSTNKNIQVMSALYQRPYDQ